MRFSTRSRSRAGVTVLEVTWAITILAVCAFGLIQTYVWGMRATKAAREEAVVTRLLANELEAWRAADRAGLAPGGAQPLRALSREAEVLEGLNGAVRIAPHLQSASGLLEVRVRVRWQGTGGRNVQREATTLIAGSTP